MLDSTAVLIFLDILVKLATDISTNIETAVLSTMCMDLDKLGLLYVVDVFLPLRSLGWQTAQIV